MAQTEGGSVGPFDKDNPYRTITKPTNDVFITEATTLKHDSHDERNMINPLVHFGLLDSEYALSDGGEMLDHTYGQLFDDDTPQNDNNNNNTHTQTQLSHQVRYILYHPLYHPVINFLYASKTAHVIPTIPTSFSTLGTSLSLDEFLDSQGLLDGTPDDEKQQFYQQVKMVRVRYQEEMKKIEQYEESVMQRVLDQLKEQCLIRPVTDTELRTRLMFIQHRMDLVKCSLIQKIYDVVILLAKKHNQFKPGKRTLPKHASRILSDWFYSHIQEPYPSEEEKMMMASQIGITMTQINNWFGNKRIRYKRKQLSLSPQDDRDYL